MRHGVYVLALHNGGFYVGKSNNIDARVQQHRDGTGSAWCRFKGGVLGEVPTVVAGNMLDVASWEMSETVAQMLMHGFEHVRGWEFSSSAPLSCRECDTIKTIVMGQGDLCRRCGGEGHFATGCVHEIQPWLMDLEKLKIASAPAPVPARNMIAVAAMAYACHSSAVPVVPVVQKTALPAFELPVLTPLCLNTPSPQTVPQQPCGAPVPPLRLCATRAFAGARGGVVLCTRCGRDSHQASSCFAHKHFNGSELRPRSPKGG